MPYQSTSRLPEKVRKAPAQLKSLLHPTLLWHLTF